jgi:hypothetical protein
MLPENKNAGLGIATRLKCKVLVVWLRDKEQEHQKRCSCRETQATQSTTMHPEEKRKDNQTRKLQILRVA